jgi:uncharacterized protein
LNLYLDTSVLVSALTRETSTPRVNSWLRAQAPATLLISEWTHTEVASALSIKLRTGAITLEARANAASGFARLATDSLPTLAVTGEHFEIAAGFAAQHALGVRAGDALHLAIARLSGLTLATLDNRMADAALALGIPAQRL